MNRVYSSLMTIISLVGLGGSLAFGDEGFYRASELPSSALPANLDRVQLAMVPLYTDGKQTCSSVAISEKGYVLTASHCLLNCLKEFPGQVKEVSFGNKGTARFFRPLSHLPGQELTCKNMAGIFTFENSTRTLRNPRVVALGAGFVDFDDAQILDFSAKELSALKTLFNKDFAVLKFNTPLKANCLETDKQASLTAETPIWTGGYPMTTTRQNGHSSQDGYLYFGFGKTLSDIYQSGYFATAGFSKQTLEVLSTLFKLPGILLSTIDAFEGNSGGPLFNSQGKLVGEHVGVDVPSFEVGQTQYVSGSAVGLSLEEIKKQIQPALFEQIFSCQLHH